MTETFFDATEPVGRGGVLRDGRGRALLRPKGLENTDVTVAYSSASGLADSISEAEFFHRWEMRYLAISMGRNQDLARLAASEPYHTGLDPLPWRDKSDSGRRLDGIIERALDRQKIHEKADYGTAFHQHTEPGAPSVPEGDEAMARDVESFEDTLRRHCIRIIETEVFTANDATMSAGTFDHGVRVLGHPLLYGYVVADKKTGRVDPFHWMIQIASYARGEVYDRENHHRQHISSDMNLEWGLVFHTAAQTGKTELYIVNLELGWDMAQVAAAARDGKDRKDVIAAYKPATFTQRLNACQSANDCRTLWMSTNDPNERRLAEEKASTF